MARDLTKIHDRMKLYNRKTEVKERVRIRQHLARLTAKGRAEELVRSARYRAKKENMSFDIDAIGIERLISECVCPYTMQPFVLTSGRNPWAPSIDRIDNSKGYTRDNIQVVSLWWNIAKNKWPEQVITLALTGLKQALISMEIT